MLLLYHETSLYKFSEIQAIKFWLFVMATAYNKTSFIRLNLWHGWWAVRMIEIWIIRILKHGVVILLLFDTCIPNKIAQLENSCRGRKRGYQGSFIRMKRLLLSYLSIVFQASISVKWGCHTFLRYGTLHLLSITNGLALQSPERCKCDGQQSKWKLEQLVK